jgi:hypothetical protein
MPNPRIPVLVKHMAVAIYRHGKIHGRDRKDKFKQSLQIAKSRCQEYGLVVCPMQSLAEDVALTMRGRSFEMKHKQEGRSKTVLFDTLYDEFDIDGKKEKEEKEMREKVAAQLAADEESKKGARNKNKL